MVRRRFWNPWKGRPTSHPGEWVFPGGASKPCDRNPMATARREMREETGYGGPLSRMRFLFSVESNGYIDQLHRTAVHAALIDGSYPLQPQEEEVIGLWTATPTEILAVIGSPAFTAELEREYHERGLDDPQYGHYRAVTRRMPTSTMDTLRFLARRSLGEILAQH